MTEVIYLCNYCNYKTRIKCNYQKHLKSKKHTSNKEKSIRKNTKNLAQIELKKVSKIGNLAQFSTNLAQNDQNLAQFSTNLAQTPIPHKCPHCDKTFKNKYSIPRHIKKYCKKVKATTNIETNIETQINNNNLTNHIETQNVDNSKNINITQNVYNIDSKEALDLIQQNLNKINIDTICNVDYQGLILQCKAIIGNIHNFSIELKKNNPELRYFEKTNARDNMISIYKENRFEKMHFDKYNRNELLKIAKLLVKDCNKNRTYNDNLDFICDVLKDPDYYKSLSDEDKQGVDVIIARIKVCEMKSKLQHYNMTKKDKARRLEKSSTYEKATIDSDDDIIFDYDEPLDNDETLLTDDEEGTLFDIKMNKTTPEDDDLI